jgi:hypothetical protein
LAPEDAQPAPAVRKADLGEPEARAVRQGDKTWAKRFAVEIDDSRDRRCRLARSRHDAPRAETRPWRVAFLAEDCRLR